MDSHSAPNYNLSDQMYESSDKTIKIFKVTFTIYYRQEKGILFNI